MSTPAILIVKYHDEARVTTVHWNGDPRSIGPTLLTHYADNARAQALSRKYDELQKKIAALYEEWEAAQS